MKTIVQIIIFASLMMALAEAKETQKSKPKSVEGRPKVEQGYVPEPIVSIRETKTQTIQEYRINGVLRAVKITPKNGMPSYYLVDEQASGVFSRFGPDMGRDVTPPRWILFSW